MMFLGLKREKGTLGHPVTGNTNRHDSDRSGGGINIVAIGPI